MKNLSVSKFLAALLFLLTNANGFAQSYINYNEKTVSPWLYLFAGTYTPHVTTTVTFNSDELNQSITSNLEDEFNLPSSPSLFYLKAIAGTRSQVLFSMYRMNRTGDGILARDINVEGTTYHVGTEVHSYFNTEYYAATFRYAVYNTPYGAAGFSLGARWLNVDAGLNATWNGTDYSEQEKISIPAVLPGVFGSTYILPQFLGRASLEYFRLSVSGITGSVVNADISLEYYLLKNLGAGAGYSLINYSVEQAPGNNAFVNKIKYNLDGFTFFIAGRF